MTTLARSRALWVGTYPVAGQGGATGRGEGVWRVTLDCETGRLDNAEQVVASPAPSFLATGPRPDLVYAANEEVTGGISVFRRLGPGLQLEASVPSGGAHPCHILIEDRIDAAVVANYSSGSVALLRLLPDGTPAGDGPDQLIQFDGNGPYPGRQESSHAHYLLATPDREHLLLVDLGADCIRKLRVDAGTRALVDEGMAVELPAGSGPRHAVFSEDGSRLYVVGELDGRLHTVAWYPDSRGEVIASAAAQSRPGEAHLAHIIRSGPNLYLGVRGHDLLAVHTVVDGLPRLTNELLLPGASPRHHAEIGGWLVVAQQTRGGVSVLDADGGVHGHADIPSPACILPASWAGDEG